MTKISNSIALNKPFSSESPFEESFRIIGKILDRKLTGINNPVIRDLAGMDALIMVQNVLCGNVITSFTPIFGIEENDDDYK